MSYSDIMLLTSGLISAQLITDKLPSMQFEAKMRNNENQRISENTKPIVGKI